MPDKNAEPVDDLAKENNMKRNFKSVIGVYMMLALFLCILTQFRATAQSNPKPRIIISSDIGGTDADDFQSVIHLLMYSNLFQIEGLVSSPYGAGRKKDFLDMIDLYEKDLPKLAKHAPGYPTPDYLRGVCKQGSIPSAPFKGFTTPTEGSKWIIKCAKKPSKQPLWILGWGGIEDLAQALHDAPEIQKNIRVYWIGGPNKKWGVNAYSYIAQNFPNLWIIENNATYRGWIIDSESPKNYTAQAFFDNFIQGHGEMGKAFKNYYAGRPKMGDTPSLAYLLNGNPDDPTGESWGGSFRRIDRSSRNIFYRNTTNADTVATYAIVEFHFKGPELAIPDDSVCFTMKFSGQSWPGYYLGHGNYAIRYSAKAPETGTYITSSSIAELNGQKGQLVSTVPWPGKPGPDDFKLGKNWYSDRQEPELFLGVQQGARTISKHREAFLSDWGKRWDWLK
jgi:hypothetical protein